MVLGREAQRVGWRGGRGRSQGEVLSVGARQFPGERASMAAQRRRGAPGGVLRRRAVGQSGQRESARAGGADGDRLGEAFAVRVRRGNTELVASGQVKAGQDCGRHAGREDRALRPVRRSRPSILNAEGCLARDVGPGQFHAPLSAVFRSDAREVGRPGGREIVAEGRGLPHQLRQRPLHFGAVLRSDGRVVRRDPDAREVGDDPGGIDDVATGTHDGQNPLAPDSGLVSPGVGEARIRAASPGLVRASHEMADLVGEHMGVPPQTMVVVVQHAEGPLHLVALMLAGRGDPPCQAAETDGPLLRDPHDDVGAVDVAQVEDVAPYPELLELRRISPARAVPRNEADVDPLSARQAERSVGDRCVSQGRVRRIDQVLGLGGGVGLAPVSLRRGVVDDEQIDDGGGLFGGG